jgi:hypothetical protein
VAFYSNHNSGVVSGVCEGINNANKEGNKMTDEELQHACIHRETIVGLKSDMLKALVDNALFKQISKETKEKIDTLFSKIETTTSRLEVKIDENAKGAYASIDKHITEGRWWRAGIVSVAVMLVIQACILASMWGNLMKTVEINTIRINKIEDLHPRQRVDKNE